LKHIYTEAGLKRGMIIVPIVFLLVWLFNCYKLGKLDFLWSKDMTGSQKSNFYKVIFVTTVGVILVLLIPSLFAHIR